MATTNRLQNCFYPVREMEALLGIFLPSYLEINILLLLNLTDN